MTTVVYKDGILASDSRLTSKSHVVSDKCKKIFRLPDGTLFGWAGDDEGGHELLESMLRGEELNSDKIRLFEDVQAIRILPKGQIYVTDRGRAWTRWPEKFGFIGTGGKYARAAMMAGADAVKAVKIAIASDVYSGGRVQQLRLLRK